MKRIILQLACFLLITMAHAKAIPVIVTFNDGHEESGFMENLMQKKMDILGVNSWEHTYNLDTKTLKLKDSEKGKARKINVDDIDHIIYHYEDAALEYKVLHLMRIGGGGKLVDKGKFLLPLVRKGPINIYGFTFVHTDEVNNGSMHSYTITTREYFFYYQNPKTDYAVDYLNDPDILVLFSVKKSITLPLQDLFKDCPQMNTEIDQMVSSEYLTKEEKKEMKKEHKEEQKQLESEYLKIPKEQRVTDLDNYHTFNRDYMEKLIRKYTEYCPEVK